MNAGKPLTQMKKRNRKYRLYEFKICEDTLQCMSCKKNAKLHPTQDLKGYARNHLEKCQKRKRHQRSFSRKNVEIVTASNEETTAAVLKNAEEVEAETNEDEYDGATVSQDQSPERGLSHEKKINSDGKQISLKRSSPKTNDSGTTKINLKARRLESDNAPVIDSREGIRRTNRKYQNMSDGDKEMVVITLDDDSDETVFEKKQETASLKPVPLQNEESQPKKQRMNKRTRTRASGGRVLEVVTIEDDKITTTPAPDMPISIRLPHHELPGLRVLSDLGRIELGRLREITGRVRQEDEKKMWFNDLIIDFALCCHAIKNLGRDQWESVWLATAQLFGILTNEVSDGRTNHICFCYGNGTRKNRRLLLEKCATIQHLTENVDLFSKKIFLIPIQAHDHWMLALVINPIGAFKASKPEEDNKKCYLVVLNSYRFEERQREKHIKYVLAEWMRKAGDVKEVRRDLDEDSIVIVQPENVPVQGNGYDCGPFVCYFVSKIMQSLEKLDQINGSFNWETIDPDGAPRTARQDVVDCVLEHTDQATQMTIANEIGIRVSTRQ